MVELLPRRPPGGSGGGEAGRRVGLFGGSFDPIHDGHLRPVRQARRALELERVIYLPTAVPPHKPKRQLASAMRRYAMVELALLDEEGLYASDHELTLGRPAYTVETVESFAASWPEADLHLLIGADSFLELATWKRWEELVRMVQLVVLARPGWELDRYRDGLPAALCDRIADGAVHVVAGERVDMSSTELRQRLASGGPLPAEAVPPRVYDYIRKYSLYR